MTIRQVKSLALIKLKGNWGNAISITISMLAALQLMFLEECVSYLIHLRNSTLSYFSLEHLTNPPHFVIAILKALLILTALTVIKYTIVRQYIDISKSREYITSRNLILKNKRFFFRMSVVPELVKTGLIILSIIPGLMAWDSVNKLIDYSKDHSLSIFVLMFFMMSVFMILLSGYLTLSSIISLHFLSLIMLLNPRMPVTQAAMMCYRVAEGNKLRIVFFHLSFVKFLPLCVLIYPLAIITPYYLMSDLLLLESMLKKDLKNDTFLDVFGEPEEKELIAKGN